ncbi:MAG: cupredoxin domain-containing protein [Actinomycetota bacterium]|nr:cupredoxin domain-containing protein [Actinomycetota bacterium]
MKDRMLIFDKLMIGSGMAALVLAGVLALYVFANAPSRAAAAAPAPNGQTATTTAYHPHSEDFTVTVVPLLVHEQSGFFDYLNQDFAKGGLLFGKEVWGFAPSTLVVYQGDQVTLHVYNPGDDPHTFTMMDLGVNKPLKPRATATLTFTASKIGVFSFMCDVAEHDPFMWGEVVVLPGSSA